MKIVYDLRISEPKIPDRRKLDSLVSPRELRERFDHPPGLARVVIAGNERLDELAPWFKDSVYGWSIKRQYSPKEISDAKLFRLMIHSLFEPGGYECGTRYDFSQLCRICGAGLAQRSDLVLDVSKIPRKAGIAVTLDNEIVVSRKLAESLSSEQITGMHLKQVRHNPMPIYHSLDFATVPSGQMLIQQAKEIGLDIPSWEYFVWLNQPNRDALVRSAYAESLNNLKIKRSAGLVTPNWLQLFLTSKTIDLGYRCRFGINPFDSDPEGLYRCPLGHTLGFNLLSEAYVDGSTWDGCDICFSTQCIGKYNKQGQFCHPYQIVFVSPKLRTLLLEENKNVSFEVAHLEL